MFRTHRIAGALALAASLLSVFVVSAAPVHAVEPLPDARILSAAPFAFHADREIFLRMPEVPSDSRIFTPREPMRSAAESHPNERQQHQQMI
jgi:hypothetical protein